MCIDDAPVGEVRLKMADLIHGHVVDRECNVMTSPFLPAKGTLHVRLAISVRRALSMGKLESVAVTDSRLAVRLGWDMLKGNLGQPGH